MKKKPSVEAVLFDIDGVLIDVRSSYIEAILRTSLFYAKWFLGIKYTQGLITRKDVHAFKLLGGFNNDWDTVFGILVYLQFLIETNHEEINDPGFKKSINIPALRKKLPSPCGIAGIKKILPGLCWIHYGLAQQIFQEYYLGPALFKKHYGFPASFTRSPGLIEKEKLLLPETVLKQLKQRGLKLGIVTGRTRFEAEYVLKRFGILKYFSALITDDEVTRAEKKSREKLRKPHPWPVLACAKKLGAKSILYAGDLPDDIRAANSAKKKIQALSAGVLYKQDNPAQMRAAFQHAKADLILKTPNEILKQI